MHDQHQEITEFIYLTCIHACSVIHSHPTFCDPPDCSPPSFSVHGIFSARILEWLPFPPPGDLPDLGLEPVFPALVGGFFTLSTLGWHIWPTKRQRTVYVFSLLLLLLFSCSACWILCDPMDCSTAGFPILHYLLLKFVSIESLMPINHLTLLPSIFPNIRVFSNESALRIRWPKFWCFSISPFNKYSGLISFRIDWFDLLAVQRTLKSLLRHHSLKASILRHSAFFMVQVSHPYMTTEKNHSFDYTDLCQ